MEKYVYGFEKLHVWADIRSLIKLVYSVTERFPEREMYCIVKHIRRTATSVSSNLAEGSSRTSAKDQAHFYQLAYSSLMELLSQIIISNDLAYINENTYIELRDNIQEISHKINSLRRIALKRITKL